MVENLILRASPTFSAVPAATRFSSSSLNSILPSFVVLVSSSRDFLIMDCILCWLFRSGQNLFDRCTPAGCELVYKGVLDLKEISMSTEGPDSNRDHLT